ncbi:hypothetical protein L3Y34_005416 [Caenorhabditis briggsae]|uniref:Uncharacterized protein n=1 Tax=Caenorhabditis briggsae TaxID=6238 RepID=A0AAE9D636_CAEBR|nr:hypothetical protein L3Y34_005416 [Caenorhabditis briggsae]
MTENFDFFIETCILYDTFHWKSPENSYQTICRKYGPDLISYTDFKALFNRISIENCNESTCKKNLAEILKSSYTALKSCILNDVSCGKSIDIAHDKILEVIGKVPWTHFQYWFQRFSDGNWDFGESPAPMAPEFMDLPIGIVKTIIENCDYSNQWTLRTELAFLELAERLSNPKLKLEVLEFKAEQCQDFEKIEKILEQIGRKIWVNSVKIRFPHLSNVASILAHLKPKILETIELDYKKIDNRLNDYRFECDVRVERDFLKISQFQILVHQAQNGVSLEY